MKKNLLSAIGAAIIIAACSTSKKNTSSTPTAVSVVATPTAAPSPAILAKPTNGVYEPGNEELLAIQTKHKDVTLEKLKEGYVLYAQSACVSCHAAPNIYNYDASKWFFIISDMASRAKLSPGQTDAVYKYVLAIKEAKSN